MRKKQRTSEKQEIGTRQVKTAKSKNKQMFTELKTHEENKISKFNKSGPIFNHHQQEMINEDDQIMVDENMEVDMHKNNQDIEQICGIVHNLILKNKISAKNAFDVPFIDLERLEDFSKISESENGWKKISSTLQNDSKIYSYRVDAIHSIAYKIMNTMTRNQDEQSGNQKQQKDIKDQNQLSDVSFSIVEYFDIEVGLQLEKNVQNINMQTVDKFSQFNPTYERTRRRFDQNGLRGLLLNNIQLDSNLELSLNQTRSLKSNGFFLNPMPVEVSQLTEQPMIFKNIENTRKLMTQITKQIFIPSTGYEISWRKIMNGELNPQIPEAQNRQNQMDIQIDSKMEPSNFKKVNEAIKLKSKKSSLKSQAEIAKDGMDWLSQKDKQMLGLRPTNSMPPSATVKKNSVLNQDYIVFNKSSISKDEVFTESTTQKAKMQYHEQIEEKHLLPLRLFHKFKVEQIMTLREQPPQALNQVYNQEQEQQIIRQREIQQIDIKRQQMSIRESKQKLKSIILKQTDFQTLCRKFEIVEKNIAPELCFLTILHLANENNLRLEQINQSNFNIKS